MTGFLWFWFVRLNPRSTVTADLVAKSLGNPSLMHIFGDTTLKKYVISITD